MNIVVIGAGYVGLTSGLGLAKLGHRIACVDIDAEKISELDLGRPTIHEPGLKEALNTQIEAGRIVFTTELASVIGQADVVIIAVGTPPNAFGAADLSSIRSAGDDIGQHLNHEALVVVKSTVPVGTTRRILKRIKQRMQEAGNGDVADRVRIAMVPEFLREGSALHDFLNPDRIVVGAEEDDVFHYVDTLHAGIDAPRINMKIESAELTKYAANAFLATKISFINEIANIAERTGANVADVASAVGLDRRISDQFLQSGIGYGGSCFPKDVTALQQLAGTKRYEGKLLSAVIEVNNRQRELFVQKVESHMNVLRNRKMGIWGLSFKPGTSDVRESPAIDIVQRMLAKGVDVTVYDPAAMDNAKRVLPKYVKYAPTAIDAAVEAEALLVLTDWDEFRNVSFRTLHTKMLEPRVFDGRNLLADLNIEQYGFIYEGVGMG